MKNWSFTILLVVFIYFIVSAQEASKKYMAGQYEESLLGYKEMIKQGAKGTDLYYNIANTYAQLKDYPNAILYYEKAMRWDPYCVNCKMNKATIEKIAGIENFELPQYFLLQFINKLIFVTNDAIWLLFGILTLCVFIVWQLKKIKPYFIRYIFLLLSLLFFIFSWQVNSYRFAKDQFVVMKDNTIHISPDAESEIKFQVKAGSKLYKKDQIEDWIKVRNAAYDEGWINSKDLALICL